MLAKGNVHDVFYRYAAIAITIVAVILILQSSRKQSLTVDEPNHIYCGIEYLQYGSYSAWPENPPLSRVVVALGPYLKGHRIEKVDPRKRTMNQYFTDSYDLDYFSKALIEDQLFWARIFILPMFLLSVWVVWRWSKRLGGVKAGFLAVGMYATIPAVLAHSGLGTTDITFVASFLLTMWLFSRWVRRPGIVNACWLGISLAASLLSKYSVIGFFPAAACVLLLFFILGGRKETQYSLRDWLTKIFASGLVAVVITCLVVWAFFGFSYGLLRDQPVIRAGVMQQAISPRVGNLKLPAPEWFAGLKVLLLHNGKGHRAYLEESISYNGFWDYYALSLLWKTPWPYLLMLGGGIAGAWLARSRRNTWEMMAMTFLPIAIMLSALPSNINIGLRHILPFYPLGAIGGAVGLLQLLNQWASLSDQWKKWIPAGLLLWQLGISLAAFPNYISYFNPWAGREPGIHVNGSDLDWGQGLFDLGVFCKSHKIDSLNIAYYGLAEDCWFDLPPLKFMHDSMEVRGWVAVSENLYRGVWIGNHTKIDSCNKLAFELKPSFEYKVHGSYKWLDKYPLMGRVGGGSIRVYHVP